MLKTYRITALNPVMVEAIISKGRSNAWYVTANSMQSAWNKFTTHFFPSWGLPPPEEFDIRLDHITPQYRL